MAEFALIEHTSAPATTLAGDITDASATINLTDGTGYPTGGGGYDSYITIDPGTASEESVKIDSRSGNALTVAASGRGKNGTSAIAHTAGAVVTHGWTPGEADGVMQHVADDTRDDHSQYVHNTSARTVSAAHTFAGGPTFSTVAPTFSAGAAFGTGTYSGNLTFSGSPTITGSVSGYGGGELRLGSAAAGQTAAISTQSTGSPTMNFDHRGTGNTGTWRWANGTAVASVMTLGATGNLSAIGSNNKLGTGALGASGTYTDIGSFGDTVATYVAAGGSPTNVALNFRPKAAGGIHFQDASGNSMLSIQTPYTAISAAGQTAIQYLAYHNGAGTVQRPVTLGAADSGGAGFKVLRVPNT